MQLSYASLDSLTGVGANCGNQLCATPRSSQEKLGAQLIMTDRTYLFRELSRKSLETSGGPVVLQDSGRHVPDRFTQECLKIVCFRLAKPLGIPLAIELIPFFCLQAASQLSAKV
jgi:hypothetical protein